MTYHIDKQSLKNILGGTWALVSYYEFMDIINLLWTSNFAIQTAHTTLAGIFYRYNVLITFLWCVLVLDVEDMSIALF